MPKLAIVLPVVDTLQSLGVEDGRRGKEGNAMFGEVRRSLALVPFEDQLCRCPAPERMYTFVYTPQATGDGGRAPRGRRFRRRDEPAGLPRLIHRKDGGGAPADIAA